MAMATETYEEDSSARPDDEGGGRSTAEAEDLVEEFRVTQLREEFSAERDSGADESADDLDGAANHTEGTGEAPDGSASGAVPFSSDRERHRAAIAVARNHGLGIDDLEELERSKSPEEVERRARTMAERRTLHRRVEALERRLAPVQQFDSNRPSAGQSGSDDAWIERYMAGDRSARAVAVARRAFG